MIFREIKTTAKGDIIVTVISLILERSTPDMITEQRKADTIFWWKLKLQTSNLHLEYIDFQYFIKPAEQSH
jgi:hypothetical protein